MNNFNQAAMQDDRWMDPFKLKDKGVNHPRKHFDSYGYTEPIKIRVTEKVINNFTQKSHIRQREIKIQPAYNVKVGWFYQEEIEKKDS